MSVFDDLDALALGTAMTLFGDTATLFPMKPGAAGPNGPKVAAEDTDRPVMPAVPAIRSEWAERVQVGGQGMPTPTGAFKLAAAGHRHVVTLQLSDLAWVPRQGDELEYPDRPGKRYRLTEPMRDGLSGLHFGLSEI